MSEESKKNQAQDTTTSSSTSELQTVSDGFKSCINKSHIKEIKVLEDKPKKEDLLKQLDEEQYALCDRTNQDSPKWVKPNPTAMVSLQQVEEKGARGYCYKHNLYIKKKTEAECYVL